MEIVTQGTDDLTLVDICFKHLGDAFFSLVLSTPDSVTYIKDLDVSIHPYRIGQYNYVCAWHSVDRIRIFESAVALAPMYSANQQRESP